MGGGRSDGRVRPGAKIGKAECSGFSKRAEKHRNRARQLLFTQSRSPFAVSFPALEKPGTPPEKLPVLCLALE